MGGSKRSLSALWHALQLFKACLNKRRRTAAGIRLQFCTPAVLYIRVFCIMLDSNICGNSAPRYILGLITQVMPCSPHPDAAATRVRSDLRPSL